MAIVNQKEVNGIALGIDREKEALWMMMEDDKKWIADDGEFIEPARDHKDLLLYKINAYIAFLQSGQYKELYPDETIKMIIIEIRFKYRVNDECRVFIQDVQNQVGKIGIKIEAHVEEKDGSNQ